MASTNPFVGSSSRKNPFGGSGYGKASPLGSTKGTLTAEQALHLAHILASKPHRSFLGDLKAAGGDVLHPVEWSFDKLMRPSYAVASGVDAGITKGSVGAGLHGAREGFMGRNKEGFGQVLQHHGILKHHNFLRGLAGFGLDVGTDPLTYLTGGVGSLAGKTAEDAAAHLVTHAAVDGIDRGAAKAAAHELAPHVTLLKKAGPEFEHRAALGHTKLSILKAASKAQDTSVLRSQLPHASEAAKAEGDIHAAARGIKLTYKLPGVPKLETPLIKAPLPTMEGIAAKRIPVVSKLVDKTGHAFVGGYTGERSSRLIHRLAMINKHQGERFADRYFEILRDHFHGIEHVSEKDQVAALHFFEKEGGVVKQGDHYLLSRKRIAEAKAAGISDKQIKFVHAMHDVSEILAQQDRKFGIKYTHLGEHGKLYIPHISAEDGANLGLRHTAEHRSLVNAKGYMKNTEHPFTLQEIQDLKAAGKLPRGVKTSPYEIFIHRVRAAANAHADATLANYLKDAVGVTTRVVDRSALKANGIAQKVTQDAIDKHPLSADPAQVLADRELAAKKIVAKHKMRVTKNLNQTITKNTDSIKRHLDGPHTQTTMATVTRLSNQSVRARAVHDAAHAAITNGEHVGVNEELTKLAVKHAKQDADMGKLQKELKRLGRQERKITHGTKNPLYRASQRRPIAGANRGVAATLHDEFGHPYAFRPEMADAIDKFERVATNDPSAIAEFQRTYMKALSKWKLGVTSVNPGYRIRNTLSDYWNMWLAGVPPHDMIKYSGRAAYVMRKAKTGDRHALEIINGAYDHGVLSGLFKGDVQAISDMLEHGGSKMSLAKGGRPIKLYTKITSDINRNMENHVRLAHYLYRREAEHLSVTQSAEWIRKAHFDYEDLTPFEQRKMKAIAPFYTWTRKNLPYQIERMALAPGKMAAFPKLANEMETASPPNKGGIPTYLNRGMFFKIPIGSNNFLNPTVGVSDLAKIEHPADAVKSLLSPALKIPVELLEHKNMMTGQPIGGPDAINPRNPINDHLAGLLSLIPGSDVGPTYRGTTRGAGAAPWLTYLAGQTPMTNLLINQQGKIKGKQKKGNDLGYLSGLSTQQVDPKLQATIDTITEGNAFKREMKTLRAEGYPLPKKRKGSANQNKFERALELRLAGRR